MMMRFRGGGVGHKSTRSATDLFKTDRHRLDVNDAMQVDEEQPEQEGPNAMEQDGRGELFNVEDDENEREDYGYNESTSEDEHSEEEQVQDHHEGEEDSEEEDGEQPELEQLGFAEL